MRYVALLRAVNVGGRTVKMEPLRDALKDLGFEKVVSYIASGNVVFDAPERSEPKLKKQIERKLEAEFGFEIDTFLRSDRQMRALASHKAFSDKKIKEATAFNVGFLDQSLDAEALKALDELRTDIDDFHVNSREIYWLCKVGQSDSKFSNAALERKLKVRSTFRSINTVKKMIERL